LVLGQISWSYRPRFVKRIIILNCARTEARRAKHKGHKPTATVYTIEQTSSNYTR